MNAQTDTNDFDLDDANDCSDTWLDAEADGEHYDPRKDCDRGM